MTDEQLITACIQKIGLAEDEIRSRFGDLEQAADFRVSGRLSGSAEA
jgi:hypothetical protein